MRRARGFTIIEVLLFLSITGLLTISLLVGTSVAIQRQEYNDAVQSFASFFRDEYAKVIAVENSRTGEFNCGNTGALRGQSDCLIVGRYVRILDDRGARYESFPLYAQPVSDSWSYNIDETQKSEYEMPWSARTRLPSMSSRSSMKNVTIAMLRHPDTGYIAVSMASPVGSAPSVDAVVKGAESAAREQQEMCIYDENWFTGVRRSLFINPYAASGDAVHVGNAGDRCNQDA